MLVKKSGAEGCLQGRTGYLLDLCDLFANWRTNHRYALMMIFTSKVRMLLSRSVTLKFG